MVMEATETFEVISREFFKYKYRVIGAWGGSRSGKTYAILQTLLIYTRKEKRKTVTVWRKTRATCKQTVMKDFIRILRSSGLWNEYRYDKTHSTFTHKTTMSSIQFEGADEEDKVHGSQQDVSYFNEITGMQEKVYLQIAQRTNNFIIADYNPSKYFWFDKLALNKKNKFVHSSYLNNSQVSVEIIKHLNSYKPIDEEFLGKENAKILKSIKNTKDAYSFIKNNTTNLKDFNETFISWINTINKTDNKYMYDVYCLGKQSEKPERIYNGWKKITLEEYDKLQYTEYNGLDIGTSSPTAMIGVKTDGSNFYIRKKLYKPSRVEGGFIRQLLQLVRDGDLKKNDMIITDSAKLAYTSRLHQEGFSMAVPAIKGAGSLETGIETLQSVNIYYVEDDDLEEEYTEYSYHLDKDGLPNDRPIQKNDHLLDALRYCITYIIPYLSIKVGKRVFK